VAGATEADTGVTQVTHGAILDTGEAATDGVTLDIGDRDIITDVTTTHTIAEEEVLPVIMTEEVILQTERILPIETIQAETLLIETVLIPTLQTEVATTRTDKATELILEEDRLQLTDLIQAQLLPTEEVQRKVKVLKDNIKTTIAATITLTEDHHLTAVTPQTEATTTAATLLVNYIRSEHSHTPQSSTTSTPSILL
jgi:hypothetical protein